MLVAASTTAMAEPADFNLETRLRQTQIDQRMSQVQQDMQIQSDTTAGARSSRTVPVFSPTLPGYGSRQTSAPPPSPSQVDAFLKGLGDPLAQTGIYAYPPEERLYRYGLMCIDAGLAAEGIRAITEHLRIKAEQHARHPSAADSNAAPALNELSKPKRD